MRLMDFDGRVTISHMSIFDRIDEIAWRFFFKRDMAKSGRFIPDQTDAT